MFPEPKVIYVDFINYEQNDGLYLKEYWGRWLISKAEHVVGYCSEDGKCINTMYAIQDNGGMVFDPIEHIHLEKDFRTDIKEICELKKSFNVDEIIRLKKEGLF